ncbi:hypothetical protein IGS67_09140 [Flavimobilis sp. GY10621]|uniref:Tetratricopeptide repeat-containing protein n=1 Tax=Flavimobilis rhizosphaerae TaxID=2775421 RepID=A0ABR9DR92_9MICO|nr:hypothetical protein [Flavimobilis rhizosphaerae]MBD9699650.1 hypothetical protein [Flavimobilis rhizosphaerae]
MRRGLLPALAVTALLAIYVWAIAGRGVALLNTGEPVGIALGAAVLAIPLLVIWLIWREWSLAAHVQRMADELAASDELPVDDLPRSPGGRIDRAAADEAFALARTKAEAAPEDWRAWYHLAFAYDAAGDRRRARATLRHTAKLHGRAAG